MASEKDYSNVVNRVFNAKPWLYPIALTLCRNPNSTPGEIAKKLGLRSAVVRRALWWLEKAGIVMRTSSEPARFKVREAVKDYVESLEHYETPRFMVLKTAKHYDVIMLRTRKIAVRRVHERIVDEALKTLREAPGQPFKAVDLARALNIDVKTATAALKVLQARGLAEGTEKGFTTKQS